MVDAVTTASVANASTLLKSIAIAIVIAINTANTSVDIVATIASTHTLFASNASSTTAATLAVTDNAVVYSANTYVVLDSAVCSWAWKNCMTAEWAKNEATPDTSVAALASAHPLFSMETKP